ncbi:penicillin-binding transpeptidase domain-containing protein [Alishewanella sp. SMS8]|uniref:penicillin-binding transpeptidase domain-containing protein n=1 Tax=Alishewanella sp. SMS8 TaxID=2994676 RepID=UPI002741417C|nr:penicillin-binding transpeptidase domain-containing protein [Alishewanella sp. SMS8]MDP5036469.1 penicillin-binding transpeptidase domain-containing protein [Alishewanella sp.]MDP5187383.1 penicillin-binding transpeptidase domain-containing protein [Alishewanella sp.]MDP5458931.1 penicillin-binding transpeptidase domain-containing protein [Alishewanella sp. SMS8]
MKRPVRKAQAKTRTQPAVLGWRFAFVLVSISAVFVALVARAAWLQVLEPDMLVTQGDLRSLRVESDKVMRGMILDRHGEALAVSVPVEAIWADPKEVLERNAPGDERRWHALAEILQLSPQQLLSRIGDNPQRRFVYLQRQVNPAVVDYVRKLRVPGIHFRQESRRYYPAGEVAAQLIGFTNVDDVGVEGVEKRFNDLLTGTAGRKVYRKDAKGREIEVLEREQATESATVVLSIDQRIQAVAYRELKKAVLSNGAASGSAVVVDVQTGEILAMVNSPSFNPNNRRNTPIHRFRNRAITDTFEPGSTMKPLAVLSALEFGSANLDTVVDVSPGFMRIGGSWVRDPSNYNRLDLTGIIQKSSNMGVARLVLEVPHQHVIGLYHNMGLGQESGASIIGESTGIFSYRQRWSDFERATFSYGYGLSVTAVQLARAYATMANGGINRPLSIIKQTEPELGERVLKEEFALAMLEMMEANIGPGGTATRAQVPGYRVGGKTGTARKAVAGGYGDDYIASFAGVGPISQPRLACVVVINEPAGDFYHGGEIAAPVFANIMGAAMQLLNLPPDGQSRPRITAVRGGQNAG